MRIFVIISVVFSITAFTLCSVRPVPVKPEELKTWITYLSSDQMKGRANGSPEMGTAADWLAGKFKEYGLHPVLPDSGYIQNYSFMTRKGSVNERNIIGMVEGTDPLLKDQFIILSAHFDHVGIRKGNSADSIYNGADDNAAGTCTLLGIAKTIRDLGLKPGRTLIFAAFSGEENGMRGSRYFVANSPVSLSKALADINFEMTGHSEFLGKKRYYMTGTKISNLDDIIGEYNRNSDWKLVDTVSVANNLFFASDNIAFSRISSNDGINSGIPGGTFATTALADYIHSPRDEGNLFDYQNMSDLVSYFSNLIVWLSDYRSELAFTEPSFARIK